jgi:hypothetical protein
MCARSYYAIVYFMNGFTRLIPSKAGAVVRTLTSGIGLADIFSGVCIIRFQTHMNTGQRACRCNDVHAERYVVELSNGKHQFGEWGDSYTSWAHREVAVVPQQHLQVDCVNRAWGKYEISIWGKYEISVWGKYEISIWGKYEISVWGKRQFKTIKLNLLKNDF